MDPIRAEFWRLARAFLTNGAGFSNVSGEARSYALASFLREHGTSKGSITDNVVVVMGHLQNKWARFHGHEK